MGAPAAKPPGGEGGQRALPRADAAPSLSLRLRDPEALSGFRVAAHIRAPPGAASSGLHSVNPDSIIFPTAKSAELPVLAAVYCQKFLR